MKFSLIENIHAEGLDHIVLDRKKIAENVTATDAYLIACKKARKIRDVLNKKENCSKHYPKYWTFCVGNYLICVLRYPHGLDSDCSIIFSWELAENNK